MVEEIRRGKFSIEGAKRFYGIGGATTVKLWVKKWGRKEDLVRRVEIIMPNELDKRKQLEEENKRLKISLADAVLKNQLLELTLEVLETDFGIDVKKKLPKELLKNQK